MVAAVESPERTSMQAANIFSAISQDKEIVLALRKLKVVNNHGIDDVTKNNIYFSRKRTKSKQLKFRMLQISASKSVWIVSQNVKKRS